MRIVAGLFKGRTLRGPTGSGVRPTSDRLRETLFNVLAPRLAGARVLDGFAGTGAVGLEALSRGAAHATFVERDPRAVAVIRDNVDACRAGDVSTMVRGDLLRLDARDGPNGEFDLVFLDPPYEVADLEAIVAHASRWVAPGGVLVLEHSSRRVSAEAAGGLVRYRVLSAGDSALSFYAPRTAAG
jgi:16S rRNA (guanine966-N2)-methyltransferase